MASVKLNVTMPPETRARLQRLADADHIGPAEAIRRLVDAAYRERFLLADNGAWLSQWRIDPGLTPPD